MLHAVTLQQPHLPASLCLSVSATLVSCYVAQVRLELLILLPQPSKVLEFHTGLHSSPALTLSVWWRAQPPSLSFFPSSALCVPGPGLGTADTTENETGQGPGVLTKLLFYLRR